LYCVGTAEIWCRSWHFPVTCRNIWHNAYLHCSCLRSSGLLSVAVRCWCRSRGHFLGSNWRTDAWIHVVLSCCC